MGHAVNGLRRVALRLLSCSQHGMLSHARGIRGTRCGRETRVSLPIDPARVGSGTNRGGPMGKDGSQSRIFARKKPVPSPFRLGCCSHSDIRVTSWKSFGSPMVLPSSQ